MSTTLNVRINGPLEDYIANKTGPDGSYEDAGEYVRDLIRKDMAQSEQAAFEVLKAELQRAFATPDEDYVYVTAEDVIERNRQRRSAA